MRRLSKNFIAIIGSDIARRILGMLTIAYLARTVSIANFGIINIGFAVLSYAMMISSLGLSSFGVRAIARGESGNLVNNIISIRFVAGFAVYIIIAIIAFIFLPYTLTKLIIIFCLSLFTNALLLDWFFQCKEKMGIIGSARLLSAVTYLIVILLFVHTPIDIIWVAIASVVGDVIASVISWIFYRRQYHGVKFQFSVKGWDMLIRNSFPLGLGSILANLSINLPTIVLGILMTNYEVGIYSAASKLVFFLLMLDRVMAMLLLPAASRLHAYSPESLASTLSTAMKWIIISAVPICVGGTLIADKIIFFIFGQEYISATGVFQILIWFFLATILHTIYTSGLIAIGKEKRYGSVMGISMIIYGLLIVVFVKYYGIIGGAAAMVIAETATLFLMSLNLRRFIRVEIPKSLFCITGAAIMMGVVVVSLPTLHLFIIILIGALVYSGILFLLRAITVTEMKNLLKKI
ncbi:MAG: flippase [Ignavibacteriales bacterium]|nr:flippase [Ignavibacteriales bacterium]